jgi:DNA polymerase-4
VGRTVTLRLRDAELARETRSRTLSAATDRTDLVLAAARDLLDARWPHVREAGCSLLGVTVSDLAPADAVQLSLDLDGHDRRALDHTLDAVRTRFGDRAVTRAALLGQGRGAGVPLLPDLGGD